MKSSRHQSRLLVLLAIGLMGVAMAGGGAWLVAFGGSRYYSLAGIALLVVAWLTWVTQPSVLWVYAAFVAATLAWSLWETVLSWSGIAARGDVFFLVGALMLTPWVVRRLGGGSAQATSLEATPRARPGWGGGRAALVVYFGVAVVSWIADPFAVRGAMPPGPGGATPVALTADAAVPAGEWHAYGRTGFGQRFAPPEQITPKNVDHLEVAWHYHTGDMRGQAGDPTETTFEVTPLKVGDRLVICTPHQFVVALDATTGQEIWRFDPKIRSGLALQHLTCRKLSYWAGTGALASAATPSASAPVIQAVSSAEPARRAAAASSPASSASASEMATGKAPAASTSLGPPSHGLGAPNAVHPTAPEPPVAAQSSPAVADCLHKLFVPTADCRVMALDPQTGAVSSRFGGGTGQINLWCGLPNMRLGGYYSTSPVVATQRVLVVGGTVLDNVSTHEASGVVRGYDIETVELVWKWGSGRPDDSTLIKPGQTYTGSSSKVWSIVSVGERLGLVYLPMGTQPPDQWGGRRNQVVERTSSSVVARDLATGRMRWAFQTVHHDLWDYDVLSQPTLVDLTINGSCVPALVQPSKQGELFVLDRRSGLPVHPVREVAAPKAAAAADHLAPTQPVSALSFNLPVLTGAAMWGVTPFDHMGSRIAFTTPLGIPCQAPAWGYVAGVDLASGKIVWQYRNGTVRDLSPVPLPFRMNVPSLGGPLLTAGGAAFLSGTLDYYLRAYDVNDGSELRRSRLPAGGQATPISHIGRDGRQYEVVPAVGHGSLGTKAGDSLIAYALPTH